MGDCIISNITLISILDNRALENLLWVVLVVLDEEKGMLHKNVNM